MSTVTERDVEVSLLERNHQGTRKRKRGSETREIVEQPPQKIACITKEFLEGCKTQFHQDAKNILARNAIVSVGTVLAATNSDEVNKINHIFLNTIKEEHVKATNQANSGRCWMFAGLNMFRHLLIKALNLKNFEFSENYLFFWDKIERSNAFLNFIIENIDQPLESRSMEWAMSEPVTDGGYWNYFVNLVNKYGLIPKECMRETFHSSWSSEINHVINDRLRACVKQLRSKRNKLTAEEKEKIRETCIQQIHDILVKFLGMPPSNFEWSYIPRDYSERQTIEGLTPEVFKLMSIGGVDLNDFVLLTHFPNRQLNKSFSIKHSSNVMGGASCQMLNVSIQELKKHAAKALNSGMPVWFGADMSRGYHPYEEALNEKLIDYDLLFGKTYPMNKAERLLYHASQANHAMCFTGVDFDEKGRTLKWQVENSWGFYDDEIPGEDGFLTMADAWFDENVYEVVIHKNQLSRTLTNLLKNEPTEIEPWDPTALAAKSK